MGPLLIETSKNEPVLAQLEPPIIVDRTATICGGFFGVTEVGCLSVSHRRDYTAADAQAVCDWLNASPTLQAAR